MDADGDPNLVDVAGQEETNCEIHEVLEDMFDENSIDFDGLGTDNVESEFGEYSEETENVFGGCTFDDENAVNGEEDLAVIIFVNISAGDIIKYHFPDVKVAYMFYNWYASIHGFSARKSRYLRNYMKEITQQTFLCHREGHHTEKGEGSRQPREKAATRCGCQARCIVHSDHKSGRWYIKYLNDMHNHKLMDKWAAMLPAHRKMSEFDKEQMDSMRKVGIKTTHILGYFADQVGGFENVGYIKRDMYNEQAKSRRSVFSDAKVALDFLQVLQTKDEDFFWRHTVNKDGRLENLIWCDGIGRRDFSVFGDVVAFDATYKKIKYLCPLVVFFGVNHHNQSVVFASALVSDESEDTYVWLLEKLVEGMDGKMPVSVITDGDVSMKNAIRRVLPNAHHRLCVWHLLRNATSNIKNPKFVMKFRQCMFGDYDVGEFRRKWEEVIAEFGLEDNRWVNELYERRSSWAAAHIRGRFFAGFRTTSRCEGLHSEFGRYVNSQVSLQQFMNHYFRWLNYMRFREIEADFVSAHGDPVPHTRLRSLERSAADVYTREIFTLFRPILESAVTFRVTGVRNSATCFMYTVTKYPSEDFEWCVVFTPGTKEFRCSCERLESIGLPCEHLIVVLMHLNIVVLPESVILKRWTKAAKDSILQFDENRCWSSQAGAVSQYMCIVDCCKKMATAVVKHGKPEIVRATLDMIAKHTKQVEEGEGNTTSFVDGDPFVDGTLRNPARVRTKGCGVRTPSSQVGSTQVERKRSCGVCREVGHNRKSCRFQREMDSAAAASQSNAFEEEDFIDDEFAFANIDMNVRL